MEQVKKGTKRLARGPDPVLPAAVRDARDSSLLIDAQGRLWRTSRYGYRCPPYRAESPRGRGDRSLMVHRRGHGGGVAAHSIVYAARVGPVPRGQRVDHLNGDRADNRPSNLTLVPATKLSAGNAAAIRRRYAEGETQTALARAFGVSQPTISAIVTRRIWKGPRAQRGV